MKCLLLAAEKTSTFNGKRKSGIFNVHIVKFQLQTGGQQKLPVECECVSVFVCVCVGGGVERMNPHTKKACEKKTLLKNKTVSR